MDDQVGGAMRPTCEAIIKHGKRQGARCGKPVWIDSYGPVVASLCYMHAVTEKYNRAGGSSHGRP